VSPPVQQWPPLPQTRVTLQPVAQGHAAQALAQDLAQRLRLAIGERGRAVLCVSGGRSPVALFEALSQQDLTWSAVCVTLADERCVPEDHADSNAALVRRHLLRNRAAAAQLLPLIEPGCESGDGAGLAAQALRADRTLRALGPADVLVLGLGTDGHTASIFARMGALASALDPKADAVCLPVEPQCLPPGLAHARVTQTLAHLLKSRHIALPVSPDKQPVLQRAWLQRTDLLPISHVLHQALAPVTVSLADDASNDS